MIPIPSFFNVARIPFQKQNSWACCSWELSFTLEYVHVAPLGISGMFEYVCNIKGLYFFLKRTDDSCCPALRHMKGTQFRSHAELWESGQQVTHPKHLFLFINPAGTLQKDFREANMQNIFYLFNVCNGSPLLSLISSRFTYKRDILSLGSCISPKHSQVCWQSFEALKYFHLTHNPSLGLRRNWFKDAGALWGQAAQQS